MSHLMLHCTTTGPCRHCALVLTTPCAPCLQTPPYTTATPVSRLRVACMWHQAFGNDVYLAVSDHPPTAQVLFVEEGLAIIEGLNNDAPVGCALAFVSGAAGALLWRRSDNICFALLLGGGAGVEVGEGVECKVKAILQARADAARRAAAPSGSSRACCLARASLGSRGHT